MDETIDFTSLGDRIVQAARLAVAMHLFQAVDPKEQAEQTLRQRVEIGRAGPRVIETTFDRADQVTDDSLPPASGRME